MRQNLALALGLKGQSAEAARVARGDLDEGAVRDNQRFYDLVRSVAKPKAAGGS